MSTIEELRAKRDELQAQVTIVHREMDKLHRSEQKEKSRNVKKGTHWKYGDGLVKVLSVQGGKAKCLLVELYPFHCYISIDQVELTWLYTDPVSKAQFDAALKTTQKMLDKGK